MEELWKKISAILWKIPTMNKMDCLGILAPLKTEEHCKKMLDCLSTVDLETTKISPIIDKALEIKKS